jgi:cytochrome c2
MSANLIWALLSGALAVGLLGLSVATYISDLPSTGSATTTLAASTSTADEGRQLIIAKGCGGCHTIPGVSAATGEVGPYLGGVAARPRIAGGAVANSGPVDLERWLLDPRALKPSTQMPQLGLTPSEAAAIVSYLETLR